MFKKFFKLFERLVIAQEKIADIVNFQTEILFPDECEWAAQQYKRDNLILIRGGKHGKTQKAQNQKAQNQN